MAPVQLIKKYHLSFVTVGSSTPSSFPPLPKLAYAQATSCERRMNVLRISYTLTAPILSSNPSQLTHEMIWNGIEYETYPARELLIASGVSQHHSLVKNEQSGDLILALSFRGEVNVL